MASVRKRAWIGTDGKAKEAWVVEYTDGTGKRRRATPKSGLKKDAEKLRQRVEREVVDGVHVADSETVTVVESFNLWIEDLQKRAEYKAITRATLITYSGSARRVSKVLGTLKLTDITHAKVQGLVDTLAKTFSPRSVYHATMALMRMIDFAVTSNYLKVNPIRLGRLSLPKREKAAKIPTRAELAHLLAVSGSRKKNEQEATRLMRHAMLCVALFSTLRRGEVCGLRWCDVDLEKGVLNIRQSRSRENGVKLPKTEAGIRSAPMPAIVREALAAIPGPRGEYVFTRRNGQLPNPSNLHLHWHYLSTKAGFSSPPEPGKRFGKSRFRFHDMRHTAASLMVAEGANPLHVARAMGHKSVNTTLGIYGHLFEEDDTIRKTADAISDSFNATKTRQAA